MVAYTKYKVTHYFLIENDKLNGTVDFGIDLYNKDRIKH